MYQGFEPREIYDRYEKINELLHRAAVTAEPLELPLVRLKLVRIGFLGIFPNQTYSWHEHPYYELTTVREGRASYFSEELSFSCDAGNRFFTATPPMTPHQLKFGPERMVLFAVNFEMEPRNPVGEQLIRLTPELLRERNSRLVPRERLWTLYSLLNSPEQTECGQVELTALYTRLFFGELLFELLPELFADRLPGRRHPHFDFEHDRINAIKAFIDHDINVRGCLPIEREFGMSERHLNRLFKAATGWSIGQYRIQRKLHVAKTLLRGSRNSIREISQSLRFGSISQFSAFFHRYCGCSPREYRIGTAVGGEAWENLPEE